METKTGDLGSQPGAESVMVMSCFQFWVFVTDALLAKSREPKAAPGLSHELPDTSVGGGGEQSMEQNRNCALCHPWIWAAANFVKMLENRL